MAKKAPRAGDVITIKLPDTKMPVRVISRVVQYDGDGQYVVTLKVKKMTDG